MNLVLINVDCQVCAPQYTMAAQNKSRNLETTARRLCSGHQVVTWCVKAHDHSSSEADPTGTGLSPTVSAVAQWSLTSRYAPRSATASSYRRHRCTPPVRTSRGRQCPRTAATALRTRTRRRVAALRSSTSGMATNASSRQIFFPICIQELFSIRLPVGVPHTV